MPVRLFSKISLSSFSDAWSGRPIYARGNISLLDEPEKIIAIIGSRENSAHSAEKAAKMGCWLAERGYVILNGLARGSDADGCREAVKQGAKVIAVLPCPIDEIYPKKHAGLARAILDNGGLLLSEHAPGHVMTKSDFFTRDEVQALVASKCVVVECGLKSGTMHTVSFCRKYSRPIACLMERELANPAGNVSLVASGRACAIYDEADLISFLDSGAPSPEPEAAPVSLFDESLFE